MMIELRPWFTWLARSRANRTPWPVAGRSRATQPDGTLRDPTQLELFGTLLTELHAMQKRPTGGGPTR
jgi:hypothetical protein